MLPTEDVFVYVYVLIDDLIAAGLMAIRPPPGPDPACNRRLRGRSDRGERPLRIRQQPG